MAAVALRISGARKTFERGHDSHVAFEGVEMEVRSGETLALLGPSGCGKSTLLRAVAGLERLDAGSIRIGDGLEPDHVVGIAFQQPSLLPWLTVRDNVGLGLHFAANRGSNEHGVVERVLSDLGLIGVADAFPDELSGGQAQRANVARLVVTGRPILLLDEPFAALDPATRAGLQDWLVDLQHMRGLTVVVVTHDVAEALRLGDRVALMTGAPGSIQHIWNVTESAGAIRNPVVLDHLRDEILARFDSDRSPEPAQSPTWPAATLTELEGAPS